MSHRKPSKTQFSDLWREDAACLKSAQLEPTLQTAWDNIDVGWEQDSVPDEMADVAKTICSACPVRKKCLVDAISDNESEGIRGGFRFEQGNVSKEDARLIWSEYSLRVKVRKKSPSEYPTMPEVRKND